MNRNSSEQPSVQKRRPWYRVLYIQVLIAIALGIVIGHFYPKTGVALKPLGDGFIALIKMMIAPVIFCTVVHGIASMSDLRRVGRVWREGAGLFRGGIDGRSAAWSHRR
jgi:aerobic C4-dicarboxylate transport protein